MCLDYKGVLGLDPCMYCAWAIGASGEAVVIFIMSGFLLGSRICACSLVRDLSYLLQKFFARWVNCKSGLLCKFVADLLRAQI